MKFQSITTADGMFYHVHGPIELRRRDWTTYVRSNLEAVLETVLDIYGDQY